MSVVLPALSRPRNRIFAFLLYSLRHRAWPGGRLQTYRDLGQVGCPAWLAAVAWDAGMRVQSAQLVLPTPGKRLHMTLWRTRGSSECR